MPMTSDEIAEHIAGSKQHILMAAFECAVREALEMNALLDEQKKRREAEPPPRPIARKRRSA
jgi:hypothetical protein